MPKNPSVNLSSSFLDFTEFQACYKEGYLVKKGHRRRNWQRRFFVLKDGVLQYYENENSEKPKGGKPPPMIPHSGFSKGKSS